MDTAVAARLHQITFLSAFGANGAVISVLLLIRRDKIRFVLSFPANISSGYFVLQVYFYNRSVFILGKKKNACKQAFCSSWKGGLHEHTIGENVFFFRLELFFSLLQFYRRVTFKKFECFITATAHLFFMLACFVQDIQGAPGPHINTLFSKIWILH